MFSTNILVGLDFDGVIIDHTANKIEAARRFGIELDVRDTPSDVMRVSIDRQIFSQIQDIIYGKMAFSAPLAPGVTETLDELKNKAIPYLVLSAQRNPELAVENMKSRGLWGRYFDGKNTFFVTHPAEKDAAAQKLGITAYIDDDASVLARMSVARKFLFDPQNAFPVDPSYTKVTSWKKFLELIQSSH